MIVSPSSIVILATTILLTACNAPDSTASREENSSRTSSPSEGATNIDAARNVAAPAAKSSLVADQHSPAGAGTQPDVQPLSEADMKGAALSGELRCSFISQAGAATMLAAAGNVGSKAPAEAIVAPGGAVVRVSQPGGFNAMVKGATFTGERTKVRIVLTGAANDGGESPARPGTLHYERDGRELAEVPGEWVCGP